MPRDRVWPTLLATTILLVPGMVRARQNELTQVDLSAYRPSGAVQVEKQAERLVVSWPIAEGEWGRLVLDLRRDHPLIEALGTATGPSDATRPILRDVDPITTITVGERVGTPGRPPGMSPFNEFFDAPAKRPSRVSISKLDRQTVRVFGGGSRATVRVGPLTLGSFEGDLQITVFAGGRLIQVESVVSTKEEGRAFLYDAGFVSKGPNWKRVHWIDTEGTPHDSAIEAETPDSPLAVRHRTIVAESDGGSVACFPPPHRYFFPRDLTDNLKYVWYGAGHRGLEERSGFGIRQSETGGGSYAPWFNAPPGTEQHLGVYYLVTRGTPRDALRETLRYTHDDRFPEVAGHLAFTSHWHMAIAMAALEEESRGKGRSTPDFVRMFREMGVKIVHLAEFHGDGHPQDPGPVRLKELEAMFAECRRLSGPDLAFLPGEEANVHLGPREPGKNAGHWLYLFPKPVYWTMRRVPGQPFVEEVAKLGKVYHVGDRDDMARLLDQEHGLAWTAHPRIKASSWAPDVYRKDDFFLATYWLGAAWKAMPADLSRERLGERGLDLLDDMSNWGARKALVGEVDVFKIDHTHELYGHMNVNYVRLDRVPRFEDGWKPLLDALRGGRFFTTTGEVLLGDFSIDGRASGEIAKIAHDAKSEFRLDAEGTFPLAFAEIITGDGTRTDHTRIDLGDVASFGKTSIRRSIDLHGKTWVRAEVWDVAGNGAFTQPVWLEKDFQE